MVVVGDQISGVLPVVPLERVLVTGILIEGEVSDGVDPMVELHPRHVLEACDSLVFWVKLLHGFVSLLDC